MQGLEYLLAQKEVLPDGTVPTTIPPWSLLAVPTARWFGRMLASYADVFYDTFTIDDFRTLVSNGYTFVSPTGWISFTRIIPDVSAEIHGARFNHSRADDGATETLIARVMELLSFHCLRAPVPSHAAGASSFAKRHKFELSGIIPMCLTYNKLPDNIEVYVRWR